MKRIASIIILLIGIAQLMQAQIKVGGNIYGGGNRGNVDGSTKVTVMAGNLNKVFGGARMANVGGNTYVNVDGKNATGYSIINYLYGGNDISGTIGTAKAVNETLPTELTGNEDGVDYTWNTYVHISAKMDATDPTKVAADNEKIYIGQAFAGGNGEYTYTDDEGNDLKDSEGNYIVKSGDQTIATRATAFNVPEVAKSYLDVQGGSIVYAYGGGNNATVKEKAVIHVDNPSEVVNHVLVDDDGLEADAATYTAYETGLENETYDPDGTNVIDGKNYHELLTTSRFRYDMGINTTFSFPSSGAFQIGRFFGGNNRAEMAIRPVWNLQSGKIRNLYSGGNKGAMSSPEGLLLEIPATSTIVVDNIFGGCRMADVIPKVDGIYTPCMNLQDKDNEGNLIYKFPNELAARVLVRGGDVNNVYGGNDITGKVYGGNAIGIYSSIRGDVYGGGNGAYPYTDDDNLKNDFTYGDLYYEGDGTAESLNAFRPNAEQVSIRLKGTDAEHPTVVRGSIYCGGNCASIQPVKSNPMIELKIGSHSIAENVFLGNNGAGMINPSILETLKSINSLNLLDPSVFAEYMEGVVMNHTPQIVFDSKTNGDHDDYVDNSSYVGSFYCGGNVGGMAIAGKNTYHIDRRLNIYTKFVGGCNNADVEAGPYNAAYEGGVIGVRGERGQSTSDYFTSNGTASGDIRDRLEINLNNLTITPLRWSDDNTQLIWNTHKWFEYSRIEAGTTLAVGDTYYTYNTTTKKYEQQTVTDSPIAVGESDEYYEMFQDFAPVPRDPSDKDIRVLGGNVYGGCYNSGHVNGNVIININEDVLKRDEVFGDEGPYGREASGVDFEKQRDDVDAVALTVFGAGCGEQTEIWGSTTVNLNNGYVFQVFGGGEEGVVGKKNADGEYAYDKRYSTNVNLKGPNAGYSDKEDGPPLAEAEYIFGGGNEGDVCGDTYVNLGNGRFYDAFGGACNADIYGGVEVTVGYNGGFPWSLDNIYGGNNFGGIIRGKRNHTTSTSRVTFDSDMLQSSTYVRYIQGRVDTIFGGNYGCYDYTDRIYKGYTDDQGNPLVDDEGNPIFSYPTLNYNSFVHFTPADNANNKVGIIFGGSAGFPGSVSVNNVMQREAYILMDDTETKDADRFATLDVYGGGSFAGVGFKDNYGAGRTAIDLYGGSIHNVYGGCRQEGFVGYTRINVPDESTVKVNSIFGGGEGYTSTEMDKDLKLYGRPCDHYLTCIDYRGENALVEDAIYGGNRNSRIAFDTYLSIDAPVLQSNGYQATVYGGGYGTETVSGRTNIFMNNGSVAYKVFGGGRDGNVFNFASLSQWLGTQYHNSGVAGDVSDMVTAYGDILRTFGTYLRDHPISLPSDIGTYVNALGEYDGKYTNDLLTNPDYHQTNVRLMDGSNVTGYAYGGGFGSDAIVSGTTYLELKGGNVDRDIYGGGQGGYVYDEYGLGTFTASTNVYIEGGMVRNVYGGGYLGHVGLHKKTVDENIVDAEISDSYAGDIPAVTNVTIGKVDGTSFYDGIPAIMRNAYGGGEGGSVYGTANLTINNGYIGYRYKNTTEGTGTPQYEYVPELDDQKPNAIVMAGNAFGGGYVINSFVDEAHVNIFGGTIRGSVYGGGEVGPIGRGTLKVGATGGIQNGKATIYKAGKTHVTLYDGHVKRNVYGGGRGYDSWGGDGTKFMDQAAVAASDMKSRGSVFGQTEVDIYGGEVGTDEAVAEGYGNVFGGGDIGFVYSAYELDDGTLCIGKKPTGSVRYDGSDEGYYYQYEKGAFKLSDTDEKILTEDCKVLVEPWCQANAAITINGHDFAAGEYVPTLYLNYLGSKKGDPDWTKLAKEDVNKEGIIIHNAVFAGGNTSPGSTDVYANTTTVFGNATASIHDAYHRDLISVGRGRIGGLYGDGNLTLVDGYRELNITNYGTDYYHIMSEITKEQYDALPKREAAYYEIRYRCVTQCVDDNGKTYTQGSTITSDEMQAVFENNTVDVLVPVLDGEGNPVLDENGYPKFNKGTGTVSMLDSDGKPRSYYWIENGVCSRYAGRPLNTIQRSDFCGVFGSRMVMQGARDRVPETVDYTNYTINRVREVSLNKKVSLRSEDAGDARNKEHGNYFGIYSVVNFLGSLTSDVDFHTAVRVTDNSDMDTYGPDYNLSTVEVTATSAALTYLDEHPIDGVTVDGSTVTVSTLEGLANLKSVDGVTITADRLTNQTYYQWKERYHNERKRNNGNSHNKVALASGVYLELTGEQGRGTGLYEKDWGLITGVVELDLINVQPGMGGGYVYAKNAHGIRSNTDKEQTILTALNKGAVSNKQFQYDEKEGTKKEWETSGNFVHSTQTIIDDCYDQGSKYLSGYDKPDGVPAHYWFIKGSVYIYNQYISAYTGAPNAYSEVVHIPLTITSASHGRLTLLNVQPSRYAYYSVHSADKQSVLGENSKIELRETEYGLNDAINYWDYSILSQNEKGLFVDETYVVTADCVYGTDSIKAGTVLLPGNPDGSEVGTYYYLKKHAPVKDLDEDDDDTSETPYVHHVAKDKDVDFDFVFRPSNNVSHDTGYILTYNVNNPNQWNTWYTPKTGDSMTGKKDSEAIEKGVENGTITLSDYEDGPTYTPITTGLYGQTDYNVGSIISEDIYTTYQYVKDNHGSVIPSTTNKKDPHYQASFYPAYIVTDELLECTNKNGTEQRFHKGAMLSKEDYIIYENDGVTVKDNSLWTAISSSVAPAYVVTSTVQLNKTDYIYRNTYMKLAEKNALMDANPTLATEIDGSIVPAYYCTDAGKYGGNYYETGHNYRGLAAFSSMSASDRANFTFNYDALDLLIDPTYSRAKAVKYQYDGEGFTTEAQAKTNDAQYSIQTPIDYSATYKGSSLQYIDDNNIERTATDGTVLTRTEFERLPNERQYYSAITVADASKTYYVVKETVILGDTPYAAGQVISSDVYNDLVDKDKVAKLNFTSTGTYYYCRQDYTIDPSLYSDTNKGKVVTADVTIDDNHSETAIPAGTEYISEVPAGIVITKDNYNNVINNQANFTIHGLAPTETSTLYVARNSDIFDLSAEKIITVIYQYDYVESDMDGMHITPVSEYHVLNIHLNFKSGVPTVEDIKQPDIILPGTTLSIPEPYVTPGAYEITGGGWVLFDTESDAESHINGVEITPTTDPLYLYQSGNYLSYYAKTYLGKTFSNHVPVSVANYQDLKKVMDDTEHHYYIDHRDIFERLKVEPKIYINDYTSSSQNGLDLFKDLYDLTLVSGTGRGYTVADGKITYAEDPANTNLVDHNLLNSRVAAGNNLEFFLRTDINHTEPWTPIGTSTETCFEGTFHGDGHALSGLNNSLFNHLCGDVYNLGVQGTFTSAGIAETGSGYVENCWISTSSTSEKTSKPVFHNPSRTAAQIESKGSIQMVNTYYQEEATGVTNPYTNHAAEATYGLAPTRKPAKAFYNGEVAYDLNGFYLYKRYCDKTVKTGDDNQKYRYFTIGEDDKLELKLLNYYAGYPKYCSSGFGGSQYVEDRFADGDFRYAAGEIPTEADERQYVDPDDDTKTCFSPIWPDDYLFFGQKLTYGYSATQAHQEVPTAIARFNGRLSLNADANRVYRAPAYYRDSIMSVAHFNPQVYLAQKSKDGTREAYPNMTAIDFNDNRYGSYKTYKTYEKGAWNVTTGSDAIQAFYPPLLDDGGLLSISNVDETRNLLVYAPAASGSGYTNPTTYGVLTGYFANPAYSDYYSSADKYRMVADATSVSSSVYGHLVQSTLTATSDHLLVDKQDFNCPIQYQFDDEHRMWYQRKPEDNEFVTSEWSDTEPSVRTSKGWQGISLPFTAELVTTNDKGEITHFYSGSESSKNSTGTKIGHEYWLREFDNIRVEDAVAKGTFTYPAASGYQEKNYTNTFLWDYYYLNTGRHNHKDKNDDTYQTYYNTSHNYSSYPLLANGTAYLLGLPGETYYEFDLSGNFEANNTAASIDKLEKQMITFASDVESIIHVSDGETVGKKVTYDGYDYYFKPSYLNEELGTDAYVLNTDGNAYYKLGSTSENELHKVTPSQNAFRPYFVAKVHSGDVKAMMPDYIVFGDGISELGGEEEQTFNQTGKLIIRSYHRTLSVTSTMAAETKVTIVNAAGALINRFTIQPGETIETDVHTPGVYLVNRTKIAIR